MRRGPLAIALAIAATAAITAGGATTAAASPTRAGTITAGGRIGPLRINHSDRADVIDFAGEPDAEELDSTSYPGLGWEALGYDCSQRYTLAPLIAPAGPSGPYCRTVYYLNVETERLGTFFTSDPAFRDAHGVRVGMPTAKADRLEGIRASPGCSAGIARSTPTASLHIVVTGFHLHQRRNGLVLRGGRVGALVLHSRHHDVGVFDCL